MGSRETERPSSRGAWGAYLIYIRCNRLLPRAHQSLFFAIPGNMGRVSALAALMRPSTAIFGASPLVVVLNASISTWGGLCLLAGCRTLLGAVQVLEALYQGYLLLILNGLNPTVVKLVCHIDGG